jgi:hypothetical protein
MIFSKSSIPGAFPLPIQDETDQAKPSLERWESANSSYAGSKKKTSLLSEIADGGIFPSSARDLIESSRWPRIWFES